MSNHYILEGHEAVPCDLMTWARWFEGRDRHVAQDYVEGVMISTVFIGLDHQWTPYGPPLIFETMVFGGPLDSEMDRYSTWQEAEEGHKKMLAKVTARATQESDSAP